MEKPSAEPAHQTRIELNIVAAASLVHIGVAALSNQELMFLQDLASAAHWARTRSALESRLRNTDFRWPIVEANGTPERAVAMFCHKYQMLTGATAVIITPEAHAVLEPWLSSQDIAHWITLETLSGASSHGDNKKELWQRVMQRWIGLNKPSG